MDKTKVVAVLKGARALVAQGWTQGRLACDADGVQVGFGADAACRWCAVGAICAANSGAGDQLGNQTRMALRRHVGRHVPTWNDHDDRTQAEVVAAFDECIAELETEA